MASDLDSYGDDLKEEFKVGERISLFYQGCERQMELFSVRAEAAPTVLEGSLQLARVVKILPGKGATLQMGPKAFAFLDICEVSDDLEANVL